MEVVGNGGRWEAHLGHALRERGAALGCQIKVLTSTTRAEKCCCVRCEAENIPKWHVQDKLGESTPEQQITTWYVLDVLGV